VISVLALLGGLVFATLVVRGAIGFAQDIADSRKPRVTNIINRKDF
jgi:hypothetical protein